MANPSSVTPARKPINPVAWLPEDWVTFMEAQGEREFRARQVFRWIQQRGVTEPSKMTDLSLALRAKLEEQGLTSPLRVEEIKRSSDGTRKLLFSLSDGSFVECVIIPMTRDAEDDLGDDDSAQDGAAEDDGSDWDPGYGGDSEYTGDTGNTNEPRSQRVTLCISSQVGCAMGCVFCASGQAGLKRGLGAHEIVAQVLLAKHYLEAGEHLRNIVFMGMGEPLHHYDETARAIRLITNPDGISISPRRITVSTVGLVPGIRRLGQDFNGKLGLAISLHAPDDATRSKIIPMNQRFAFAELLKALHDYPLPKRRRITIEYTLIAGINDSREHALKLAAALRGLRTKVNLIPMNSIAASTLAAPAEATVDAFAEVLAQARVSCSVRKRRGDDVNAACGQLALASADPGSFRRGLPVLADS